MENTSPITSTLPVTDNPVLHAIYQRRAVRRFKETRIDKALTEQLLDAGRMAPSAMNRQPWLFHVVDDPDTVLLLSAAIVESGKIAMLKEGLKEAVHAVFHPGSFHFRDALDFFRTQDPIFHGAPLVIFISAPKSNDWASLDIGMCAQNMMLAAHSLGLASCPVGLGKFVEKTRLYPKLKVPSANQVKLAVIFGYAGEMPGLHERMRDNAVWMEK